jgi:hypothetical protein
VGRQRAAESKKDTVTDYIKADVPHFGIVRYTAEALKVVTTRHQFLSVADVRKMVASELSQKTGAHADSHLRRLRRDHLLAILADWETAQIDAGRELPDKARGAVPGETQDDGSTLPCHASRRGRRDRPGE